MVIDFETVRNECLKDGSMFVVGVNNYTDKKGIERSVISCLRPYNNLEDGFSSESVKCTSSVINKEISPNDYIKVFYGAPRMYNGSAWSPVESVLRVNE